jgi:fibronectin type 3 domain-containing protein
VSAADFESERFAVNLVERLGWAVVDATEAEREAPEEPARGRITGREKPRRRPAANTRDEQRDSPLEPVGSA